MIQIIVCILIGLLIAFEIIKQLRDSKSWGDCDLFCSSVPKTPEERKAEWIAKGGEIKGLDFE